ncbi:hypothetical protein ABZ863_12890 [Saccharomonospora sp. NPDC046836]|uniref:hypothetical protein n=1 Tax=Saccharomonospora sp. NPDC046836 TaxID=3156921 RepID=UPI0033C1631F
MMRPLPRLLLALVLVAAGPALLTVPAQAATGSAVTVAGSGPFDGLRVTVSQTRDLINQTVRVSWKGGTATGPAGNFGMNYLQIMQCWGDAATGPTREQCQYGGLAAQSAPSAGDYVRLRQVSYGRTLGDGDPKETYLPSDGKQAVVPFTSAGGKTTAETGEFFDAGTTNEIPLAKTRLDGTGEVDFEVQTALESYGLGCGNVLGNGKPRSCWLVAVPRGATEVNGRPVGTEGMPNWLVSSPLSASNWQHRIAVKLDFRPVGSSCPLGAAERPTSGHEFIADAMLRWQPALCAGGGTVFGFTQVPDAIARGQLAGAEPGLTYVTLPVAPDAVPPDRRMVYAPVALSGLALAFVTERQSAGEGVVPEDVWRRDGQLINTMNLTPRLVAKLLSQSYAWSIPGRPEHLAGNPASLTKDPDFLAINEEFKTYGALMSIVDAVVPSGDQDMTELLWSWVNADREARAFLDGEPDKWGMKVNPNYGKLALPISNFPKSDLACWQPGTLVETCALTLHPPANDMHEAGRAISRGDTLGKAPSGLATPDGQPELKRVERQPQGSRGLIAVVDTATAARYGLATARLRTASGDFVAPTNSALLAGAGAMRPTPVPGVQAPNTQAKTKNAYPLVNLSYATTAPAVLTTQAGAEYADLIRFAVGPGQTPGVAAGQLPDGYAPLPAALRAKARSAADAIERQAGKPLTANGADNNGDAGTGGSAGNLPPTGDYSAGTSGSSPGGTANGVGGTDEDLAAALGVPHPATAPDGSSVTPPRASAGRTPAMPLGWLRYGLAAAFVLGGLAAGGSPLLQRLSMRLRR